MAAHGTVQPFDVVVPPERQPALAGLLDNAAADGGRLQVEASTTPPGFADLQSGMTGSDQNQFRSWTASLRHCGFLVQIQGADRELVLQAARALRPIPAGAH